MRIALALMLVLASSSCVATSVTQLSTKRYERLRPHEVRVFMTEEEIPGRYEEIALITAEGDSAWTDHRDMLDKARQEAADLGANGLLVHHMEAERSELNSAQSMLGMAPSRYGKMVAIRVFWTPKNPAPTPEEQAAAEAEEVQSFDEWLAEQEPGRPEQP